MSVTHSITVDGVTFTQDESGQWLNSTLSWLATRARDVQTGTTYEVQTLTDAKNMRQAVFYYRVGNKNSEWKVGQKTSGGFNYVKDDLLNFWKNGDLLYGTERMRAIYRQAIKFKFETEASFVTADEVNYFWLEYLRATNAPTDDPDAEKFSDYGKFLVCYAPRNKPQGQYYPGRVEKLALAHKSWPQGYRTTELDFPNERRSCKALVRYITMTPGRRIHFILSGISLEESYTLAEMRFAVKHISDADWKRIWFYQEANDTVRLRYVEKSRNEIRAMIDQLLPP